MAINQQVGVTLGGNIKNYQVSTDVLEANYPTNCGPGSRMELIDETTHTITGYKKYDGTKWNAYA